MKKKTSNLNFGKLIC